MTTSKREAQWVLRAQLGDREALECLLRSVQPSLHSYLRSLAGTTDADDVLQEVLILVCRKLGALRTPELFRPWVFRTASRAAFRHLRKQNRSPEQMNHDFAVLEDIPAESGQPPAELLQELLESSVFRRRAARSWPCTFNRSSLFPRWPPSSTFRWAPSSRDWPPA